jgi:hypothetical protein
MRRWRAIELNCAACLAAQSVAGSATKSAFRRVTGHLGYLFGGRLRGKRATVWSAVTRAGARRD